MKLSIVTLIILALFFSWSKSWAQYEFKHIKLGKLLQERKNIIESSNANKNHKGFKTNNLRNSLSDNQMKIGFQMNESEEFEGIQKELQSSVQKFASENETPDLSPVFQNIQNYLQGNFQAIGENRTQTVLNFNRDFNLGEQNISGFSWEKPMGYFHIGVNRQLAPDLFHDTRWIVVDTFVVSIDAMSYLNRLQENEMIDMTDSQIRAFAGIGFQRTYTYEHYADSFKEGLTSDFSKLFMSFLKFRKSVILNMQPYEYIKKEDYLSAAVGGMASVNFYGISAGAGVIAQWDRVAQVTVRSLGPNDNPKPGEFLRLYVQKSKSTSVGITLDLQIDLYEILKLHLFTYDYEYESKHTQSINLSFYEDEKEELRGNTQKAEEFYELLRLKIFEVDKLHACINNITSLEERKDTISKSQYKLFHYKNLTNKDTELIRFTEDDYLQTFYKHHYLNQATTQSIIGELIGGLLSGLLGLDSYVPDTTNSASKYLTIEYKGIRELHGTDESDIARAPSSIDLNEDLTVTINQEFYAKKTDKNGSSKYRSAKKKAISFINSYSLLEQNSIDMLKSDDLKGPLKIQSTIRFNYPGVLHLNSLSEDEVFYILAKDICKSKRASKWKRHSSRKKYLRRLQIFSREVCTKKLGKKYLSYKKEMEGWGQLPLKKFRKFMEYLRKKSRNIGNYARLFGEENLFVNGVFTATTSTSNMPFRSYFEGGDFTGLGIIHSYMLENQGAKFYDPLLLE